MKVLHLKVRRDLRRLGLQALTVALLVASGVGLLVSAWSSYETLRRARDLFYASARLGDSFADLKRAPRDLIARVRRIPEIIEVDDRVVLYGRIYVSQGIGFSSAAAMARLISLPRGGQPPLNQVHIRQGRLPRESRTGTNRIEVLVHESFAKAHALQPGAVLRAVVEGRQEDLQVVGVGISPDTVYALSGRTPFPDDKRFGIFWVPRQKLEVWGGLTGGLKDSFNHLSVSHSTTPQVQQLVQQRLSALLRPYGARSVVPRSRQLSNLFVEDEIRQQRISAVIYPVIFLAVAAFLIHVATSRWVELQRGQIATLKSLGYSHWEVTRHLLELVLWILLGGTFLGLLLGTGLGRLLAWSYQQFFRFPSLEYYPSALGFLLGVAAGILPGVLGSVGSLRALFRLQPAQALRPLSPPEFRGSAKGARLSIPLRMVWRNLFLRRSRLIMAVIGIGAGVSIVVLSGSWRDILDHLIEVQFSRAEREDMMAFLVEPRPLSVIDEVRNIPGVLSVEGYRFSPAKLRFRQSERDVAVLGWSEQGQHRQRLGLSLNEEPLIESGILLPSSLARLWGARPGDEVVIEFQEGDMPIVVERIVGISESRMGNSIIFPMRRLSKILEELPKVSMLTLQADPERWLSIQKELEQMPGVGGAAIKRWRLEGFKQTVGKIIRVSTLVLGGFALLIAGGVVFNLVRVSFSERSWEMASLRVLGFSEVEVFGVLAREVIFEVTAALVPGFVLGYFWVWLSRYWIHTEAFSFPVLVEPSTYGGGALTAGVALVLGLASCWSKSRKLSAISALQARE
ncbi:MAG: ABC transporter permease [Oligoflexia bacterium]